MAMIRGLRLSFAILVAAFVFLGIQEQADGQTGGRAVPANATAKAGGGWTCNDGHLKRDETCVTIAAATDAEIRELLVQRSIAAYSGSCACPFNTDRAGRRCGARSAYSRPGGAAPACYESDITDEAVKALRKKYPPKK